jgi:hypothetical protein
MGNHLVTTDSDEQAMRNMEHAVLRDLHVLEKMFADGCFETGIHRIGAEQELFLVDERGQPSPCAMGVLELAQDPRLTTEIALFNLEANLSPLVLQQGCFHQMESELNEILQRTRSAAAAHHADIVLCGILPTISEKDLLPANRTPNPRFVLLDRALAAMRGEPFRIALRGRDELEITHDDILFESCNTSFQVHYQLDLPDFARGYNLTQLLTGPVLASAVNSPILLGKRLWKETLHRSSKTLSSPRDLRRVLGTEFPLGTLSRKCRTVSHFARRPVR